MYVNMMFRCSKIWIQSVCRHLSSDIKPIKMAYSVFDSAGNSGSPLIVMHGLFGSKQNWRAVGRTLESKLKKQVYTVDARNHGDSPHTKEHGSENLAEDVAELIRQHGFPKACVMGHSMGGRAMMYLALKYPELVDRCIILDISPISIPRDFSHMENIFYAMKNVSVSSDLPMSQGRKLVEQQLKSAVGDQGTIDFIMLNLRKHKTGEFYWALNIESLQNNLRFFAKFMELVVDLKPFGGPTMFICGNQSNYVDPDSWPSIQKMFPNSELHWLDAGHLVHYDQPLKFVELVVKFLKK